MLKKYKKGASAKDTASLTKVILSLVLVAILGIMTLIFGYFLSPWSVTDSTQGTQKTAQDTLLIEGQGAPTFDFYDSLPNQVILPIPEESEAVIFDPDSFAADAVLTLTEESEQTWGADMHSYHLQIQSFHSPQEADAALVHVLTAKVNAYVDDNTYSEDGERIYQVRSESMDSEQVWKAQENLKSVGIDAVVVQE